MRRLIIASLALLGMVAPCLAQSPSQGPPDFGIDTSGTLRSLSVRDATLGSRVPLAILDTTTHAFVTPAVLVEAYGAISGDALDDRSAIQAALTAAAPAGRCVSGGGRTYLVNGNIVLPNGACLQDIKLVETGTGARRPITSDCGSGAPWTQCEGPFTLRRVRVDRGLSDSATDSAGIHFAHASKGILMEDVEVTGNGAGQGIAVPNSSNIKLIRPWIHDMEWTNTSGVDLAIEQITGFFCAGCSNLEIVNPRIENMWGTIPWVAGQNLAPSQGKPWRTNAGNTYRTTETGVSGATPPTCTGTPGVTTCSDGLKTWTYMGPAATTKRAYQADGTGFSGADGVTISGGIIRNTWNGIDIGASNNVWLYGVTYIDPDNWGEKWCHQDTNSGSIGSRVIRPGIAGVVTCAEDPGPLYIKHHRVIDALVTDPGANGNYSGTHAGFWVADGTDIQYINTAVIDSQAIPTMTVGYRSDATTVPLGTILINPYVSGGTARSGIYGGVLEGPYGTAVAADTGASGHKVPYLDVANTWSAAQAFNGANTFTGGQTFTATAVTTNLYVNGTFDTAQALNLSFRKSRATPTAGDALAAISFQGTNSTPAAVEYSQIKAVADTVTAGSEVGTLRFYTGTASTERARIGLGMQFGSGALADPGLGNARAQGGFQVSAVGVASLPACSAALEGMMRGVTDANSTTYNATAAAGGANHMPVYCNGTNWVLH